MSLFQKVIVKKYLKNLPSVLIAENYKKYTKYFNDFRRVERIRTLKEEQYQEGFLRELFVDCLNYTINPNEDFNLTTEFKNKTDAEKADGAILKNESPIAVIELKSTKTKDLKTIEKQAFNYKAHQVNCKYVITSNFEKIRLYINDATEFEEFNIFKLSENEFKFLYLCFSKESIFEDIPAEMKEKSNQHEEQISKKLYNDYSVFRNSIFQNLTKNNPQFDKLILFNKSQKLLDRFLFIFFAEDKGLIPPNTISKIIDDYTKLKDLDAYTPLYKIFAKYFSYINKGYEKLSIDAYNGGLFQFDEILDNVKIDDEILITDSLKLSNYDFDSEIDVNILGHIFEHSLTDIEKLNAEISGENLDTKQTRRKKEGVFYTPNYITKYIVENTVGTLCTEKKDELKLNNLEIDKTYFKKTRKSLSKKGEQLFDKLEHYKEWLLSLKILDPACGSGAFLNQALNFLIDEHNFIIDLETDLRKGQLSLFDIDAAVLENNLYGVDINEESVEIAKLSLWLKTAKKGRKLTDLSKHIKCGNSLIDDPEIAGEKAFDWNKEFPEIMQKGGFDVVIGNPPYVRSRCLMNAIEKKYFTTNYEAVSYQLDLYKLFIEKSLKLINIKGILSFITPSVFLSNDFDKPLRKFILINYNLSQISTSNEDIFADATVKTVIFVIKRKTNQNNIDFFKIKKGSFLLTKSISSKVFINQDYMINENIDLNSLSILMKLQSINKLDELFIVKNGIKVRKELLYHSYIDANYKPFLLGKNIDSYSLNYSGIFIHYLQENEKKFSNQAFRTKEIFECDKLIVRQILGKRILTSYDKENYYTDQTTYVINNKSNECNLLFLLSIMNSKMIYYYFKNTFSDSKVTFPKVKRSQILQFPIKQISLETQQPFIEKADLMLSYKRQKQEKINNFLHRLETNFELEKLSNKIKAFYDYDFKTLLSELKKKKIKLTFSQQDEFEEYFNSHKDEINELQNQITKTDKEIDQMVYELYNLTDDDIKIIEENTF